MSQDIQRATTRRGKEWPPVTQPRQPRIRVAPRRVGRPSRTAAEQLGETILDVATDLILSQGYGPTSVEAIVRRTHISKRTFYSRYRDKGELFGAVVRRVVERLSATGDVGLFQGGTIEEILKRVAQAILNAALSSEALALYRVVMAEAVRFPELATVMSERSGNREIVFRIAALLEREARAGHLAVDNALFAAVQFVQMVTALPQRRGLGLGTPMTPPELEIWARETVSLFLNGWRGPLRL